jgi:predicted RecB family nuclease
MANVNELCESCLRRGPQFTITARTVYDFVKSPFKIWCDCNAPAEAKDPLTEFDKLLLDQGRQHEERTVATAYPEAETLTYATPEEGFRLALDAMRDGIDAMHNVPIFYLPEGLVGRADILERNDEQSSVFGNYHYIIKEIKLAKNIRDYHRIQTAYYTYLLGKIQGYTPDHYILINRDRDELSFRYNETEVLNVLNGILEIYNGKEVSPTFGSCDWPWETYCNEEAIRRQDISLVGQVGPSFKAKLVAAEFRSVSDLATARISDLTCISGIGDRRASRFQTNATAIVKGTHIKLADVTFPTVSTEIFLDLEGTGEQISEEELVAIDYLIGVLVRRDGAEEYIPFLACDLEAEGQMFQEFLDWLARQEDYLIYHWHHYEKTHLKRLGERHDIDEEMSGRLFGRLRDLYKDAVSCFAFPTYGYGLKQVASYMGFSWRDEEIDAMESAALYFQYVQNPNNNFDKLSKILTYNEDDCMATRTVKDWMITHCV